MAFNFDFEAYEHNLERIKKCRTELSKEDLDGRYRKSFQKLLDSVHSSTDELICSHLAFRFPEGRDNKPYVMAALMQHNTKLCSIYHKVSMGTDMVTILCEIMDVTDQIVTGLRFPDAEREAS